MKQLVAIILSGLVTAAVLIWSLTATIQSHKVPQHEHAEVTHSADSH